MSRRCAFLTMDSTTGWSIDADLGIAPLEALGWRVEQVAWRSREARWDDFDAVYIGTPWDYPDDVTRFLDVLARIDASRALLVNPLELVLQASFIVQMVMVVLLLILWITRR